LGQEQPHIHFGFNQSESIATGPSDGPQSWGIEVHVDLDLYGGYQLLAEMKHFQVRFEPQGHFLSTYELELTLDYVLEILRQSFVIGVSGIQLIGIQFIGISVVGYTETIVPTIGCQDRFTVVSVVVQQCLDVGFEVVSIGLGADESAIQSHIDLFQEGVGQIVGESHDIRR